MNHLRGFGDLGKADTALAGGKGASLGEMTNAGIPVPPGYVILAGAFDAFLEETDIKADIEAILAKTHHDVMHEVESASEKIQEIILSQELPLTLRDDILVSFKSLDAKYVAVRSSATAEDGAEHAWAGQLDTYLNTTEDKLLENVKKCWASLFTPRAIFYRFEKGLAATHISVAVVVQKMVASEYSGIAFSVHPVTEDRNQMIIEAGFGLGEAIVSGQVTPDSYVVSKSPREIIDLNVSDQSRALYRAIGGGNEWRELGEKGGTQVLMKEQIFELAEIVMRIENHYGFPCDIEWAYEAEKFYITQSRPITTLSPESGSPKEISLLHMYSAWSKNWESEFSLLASDIGLRVYHSFQDIYGVSLSPIITHKQGVTSCFYADVELDAFTSHLWSLYTENPAILDTWIKEAQQRSDELALLSKQSDVVSLFSRFNTHVDAFGAPNFAIREITNPIDASGDTAALHKVTEYRKYTEMFYYNMDVFLKKLIQALTHTSGYEDGLIASLTLDELVLYIQGGVLPEKHVLQQRRDASVAWWVSGTLTYYNGDIDEALSILHGTYDGSGRFTGVKAFGGKTRGTVKLITSYDSTVTIEPDNILVTGMTDPRFIHLMHIAKAFITDAGGMLSHAAIVARELKKPCIVGTKIATQVLKDGDVVEVDADNGIVRIIEIAKKGVSAKKELDKNHLSLSEWFADAGVGDQDAFRNEDNEKRERLKILHSIIGIPFDTPTQFLASDIKNKTPAFLTFLRDHGDEPCALRLIPTVEGLPKLRMRGQTIRNVTETWFNEQGIDVEKYRADFMPHSHESLWSTIFVVNEHGIFGEMVHGGHDQLTSGHYENATERYQFSYDFKTWSMAPHNEDALHHIQEVTTYVRVPDEAKQQRITHELGGVFYADYIGGYFESVLSKEFGLWFVDYNRILGSMYASMTLPTYVQSDSASIQGTVVYGKGVVQGTVVVLDASSDNLPDVSGVLNPILVTAYTMPQHVPLMKQSVAIITNEGGLLSHASIISRELKKPCIIGTKIATQVLKDGDLVEVDANTGVVRKLEQVSANI